MIIRCQFTTESQNQYAEQLYWRHCQFTTVLYLDSVVDLQYPGITVLCLDFDLLQYADNMLSPTFKHLGMFASASTIEQLYWRHCQFTTVLYLDSVVDLQYPGITVLCLDFDLLQYADNMLSPTFNASRYVCIYEVSSPNSLQYVLHFSEFSCFFSCFTALKIVF